MFSINEKARKLLVAVLVFLSAAFILSGIYLRFFTPVMPECNAVVRTEYNNGEWSISRILFVSIVNVNERESAFIINGKAIYNNQAFTIARTITMTYTVNEGRFVLRPTGIVRRPPDDADREELEKLFPVVGKDIVFTVEKINDQQYIFADNHSPNFICNRR